MKKSANGKTFNGPPPKKGEVWMAWVDFEGSEGGKERPVVIARLDGNFVYVKTCTTKGLGMNPRNKLAFSMEAGLDRECYVLDKPQRISKNNLKYKMGELLEDDLVIAGII